MAKYLDSNGLLYVWQKMKLYVGGVIPTKTSDLVNDSGFVTDEDIPEGSVPTTTIPGMDGTAAVGTETKFARGDHIHPTDTSRAPVASPGLTGTPTAPTATTGTNTTQIATTAFVQTEIEAAQAGAAKYKGVVNSGSAISGLASFKAGWYWLVGTAGTYVGQTCEVGDMIFCNTSGTTYSASYFDVVQNNIESISNADIDIIVTS